MPMAVVFCVTEHRYIQGPVHSQMCSCCAAHSSCGLGLHIDHSLQQEHETWLQWLSTNKSCFVFLCCARRWLGTVILKSKWPHFSKRGIGNNMDYQSTHWISLLNILTCIQQSGLSYLTQFLQEQSTALFRGREMPFPVAKSLHFPMSTKIPDCIPPPCQIHSFLPFLLWTNCVLSVTNWCILETKKP